MIFSSKIIFKEKWQISRNYLKEQIEFRNAEKRECEVSWYWRQKAKFGPKHGIKKSEKHIWGIIISSFCKRKRTVFFLKGREVWKLSLRALQHLGIMKKRRPQQRKFSGFFARPLASRKSGWRLDIRWVGFTLAWVYKEQAVIMGLPLNPKQQGRKRAPAT